MLRRRESGTGEDIFTSFAGQIALSVVRRRLLPVLAPLQLPRFGIRGGYPFPSAGSSSTLPHGPCIETSR